MMGSTRVIIGLTRVVGASTRVIVGSTVVLGSAKAIRDVMCSNG